MNYKPSDDESIDSTTCIKLGQTAPITPCSKFEDEEVLLLYDSAFDQTGGFGNYQILTIILNTIVVNYGGVVAYNFGYLTAR